MNLKSWMIIALSIMFTIATPNSVFGQAFERGYQAFQKGDYRKAKKYLEQGVRQTKDRYDKALMYKLLGISEYSLGKKPAAASNFKKAIQLDPAIKISKSETRNRGIVSMFNKLKSKSGGRAPKVSSSSRSSKRPSFRSARRGRQAASRRGSGGNQTSLVTNLLPFGIPQFLQGKPITGAILAAGQAAGLFLFAERTAAGSTADKEALGVIQDQDANGSFDKADFDAYIDANEAFVLKARQEATQGLIIFGVVYAAGALEAIVNQPSDGGGRRRADIPKNQNLQLADQGELIESIYIAPNYRANDGLQWGLFPDNEGIQGILSWKTHF